MEDDESLKRVERLEKEIKGLSRAMLRLELLLICKMISKKESQ